MEASKSSRSKNLQILRIQLKFLKFQGQKWTKTKLSKKGFCFFNFCSRHNISGILCKSPDPTMRYNPPIHMLVPCLENGWWIDGCFSLRASCVSEMGSEWVSEGGPPHPGNDGGWPAWVVLFLALLAPTGDRRLEYCPCAASCPAQPEDWGWKDMILYCDGSLEGRAALAV